MTQKGHDDSATQIAKVFSGLPGTDAEKKSAVDQAFRDTLCKYIADGKHGTDVTTLIQHAVNAVKQELCLGSTPFVMLSDAFDGLVLQKCSEVFTFVEDNVKEWKSEVFYAAGKNYLLRMCNDLLRRLSKSLDTVFCGRIQLFLARLFPLDEKSGVNLVSQFNYDNVTVYSSTPEEVKSRHNSGEGLDIEEGEMDDSLSASVPIDYNMYRRFWSLQDYFRKPNQCYEKLAWRQFVAHADEVLRAFTSNKLDDMKSTRKKSEQSQPSESRDYFAKYLTSEKLLDLQLSDGNFRRYVLVQFLILFQYLNATVKFKGASHVLTEEQTNWIKDNTDKVYQLIRETPPDGDEFAKTVEHIMNREDNWNAWKNDGCQSYIRTAGEKDSKPKSLRVRKRCLGDDIKATGSKVIKMGHDELTRLWNLCPDNIEACKSEKRTFLPTLESFFEESIEQADPENQVEEQYKLVNDPNFSWRALRLLAKRSPYFFTQIVQTGMKLPEYIESMIKKIQKETPSQSEQDGSQEMKTNVGEEEGEIKEDQQEEPEEEDEANATEEQMEPVDKEHLKTLSEKLGSDWKKLAVELNFPEDDIAYLESETQDPVAQASKLLTLWQENEPNRATAGTLKTALKEVGLVNIANDVFGS